MRSLSIVLNTFNAATLSHMSIHDMLIMYRPFDHVMIIIRNARQYL